MYENSHCGGLAAGGAIPRSHRSRKWAIRATVAADGEEAWRIIETGEVSLLISDWMMPRLNGPDLCRRIRAAGGDHYVYIILLTSLNGRENRLEGLRAGADDFLTKPPDPDELAVRLEIAGRILNLYDQLALSRTLNSSNWPRSTS